MTLSVTFVPVRKIKPTASRWNFPDDEIDRAAYLVNRLEGLVNPIVLRRADGSGSYEVLEGNFEYYAAARASEIDPRRCEEIAAFIVDSTTDEEMIQQQVEIFRSKKILFHESLPVDIHPEMIADAGTSSDMEERLRSIEARQATLESRQITIATQEIQALKQQLEDLKHQLSERTNLLVAFNQSEHAELLHRMKCVGLIGKNAEKIVEMIEYERQYKPFASLRDVVTRVKGLTYEKMVDLVEVW